MHAERSSIFVVDKGAGFDTRVVFHSHESPYLHEFVNSHG